MNLTTLFAAFILLTTSASFISIVKTSRDFKQGIMEHVAPKRLTAAPVFKGYRSPAVQPKKRG